MQRMMQADHSSDAMFLIKITFKGAVCFDYFEPREGGTCPFLLKKKKKN